METTLEPVECGRVFRAAVKKRPIMLKGLPFRIEVGPASSSSLVIGTSFQLGEPYGDLTMSCTSRQSGTTNISFDVGGNMRGRMAINSLLKHIVAQIESAAPTHPVAATPAPGSAGPELVTLTVVAPAGWYPDPERPGGHRYFDGSTWTDHRA